MFVSIFLSYEVKESRNLITLGVVVVVVVVVVVAAAATVVAALSGGMFLYF